MGIQNPAESSLDQAGIRNQLGITMGIAREFFEMHKPGAAKCSILEIILVRAIHIREFVICIYIETKTRTFEEKTSWCKSTMTRDHGQAMTSTRKVMLTRRRGDTMTRQRQRPAIDKMTGDTMAVPRQMVTTGAFESLSGASFGSLEILIWSWQMSGNHHF